MSFNPELSSGMMGATKPAKEETLTPPSPTTTPKEEDAPVAPIIWVTVTPKVDKQVKELIETLWPETRT